MELSTITMDRNAARRAFLDYRAAVRARHDAEDEQIMRGYRALSQGRQLINLRETLEAGGLVDVTYLHRRWAGGLDLREARTSKLPALAVMRADLRQCWLRTDQERVMFTFRSDIDGRHRRGVYRFRLDLPGLSTWTRGFRAMVPIVPPALRPADRLGNYVILWEAEWALATPPRPPGDPALLKHIGGELYAVVAVWDLTPLERAVLAARSMT